MEVFISWSGARSEAVAMALRAWLPLVVNALRPWLSSADIDKGTRWGTDIAEHLQAARAGIVCLTPSNIRSDWLLFEAGALSKTIGNTLVCTLLVDLEPSDIAGPLTQFQATRASKDEILKLVKTLNGALGDGALSASQIQEAFEILWPKLDAELKALPPDEARAGPRRDERDLLDEMLNLLRNQNRSSGAVFPDEDFRAALTARATKAVTSSGFVGGIAINPFPDRLRYSLSRRDGGGVFEVVVPTNTPLEAVEQVVKAQLLLVQQPPLTPTRQPPPPPPPNAAR